MVNRTLKKADPTLFTNLPLHILEHKQAGKLLTKISSKMEKYDFLAFKINLENVWCWKKLGWIHL